MSTVSWLGLAAVLVLTVVVIATTTVKVDKQRVW
jgi:hypothetical protein